MSTINGRVRGIVKLNKVEKLPKSSKRGDIFTKNKDLHADRFVTNITYRQMNDVLTQCPNSDPNT